MSEDGVRASVGFFSDPGPRPDNQDFAAALFGWELQPPRHDVIAVLAGRFVEYAANGTVLQHCINFASTDVRLESILRRTFEIN